MTIIILMAFCCHSFYSSQTNSVISSGIITSLIATGVVLLITEIVVPYLKFGKLSGKYVIYWIKDYDKGGDEIDFSKPMGEVEIKYKAKNKLEIIHKQTMHDDYTSKIDHQWKGTLIMETSQYGTIAFYYYILWGKPLEANKHRLGFKKVIYDDKRENKKIIYLIGDRAEGYGKEVLIEKS